MSEEATQGTPEESQSYNPSSQSSKVDRVRELIVGPEKRAIENQLTGMKELFSQMLVENKKDYDRQVNDMKSLFVTILEENRKSFKDQLTDLSESLPKVLQKQMRHNDGEGIIFLSEDKEKNQKSDDRLVDKYNRIDAVKQIVLGGNMADLDQSITALNRTLDQKHRDQQNALSEAANHLEKKLANTSSILTEAVAQMMDKFEASLSRKDDDKAGRKLLTAYMRELSQAYQAD